MGIPLSCSRRCFQRFAGFCTALVVVGHHEHLPRCTFEDVLPKMLNLALLILMANGMTKQP